MRKFNISVNGKSYEVEVEEIGGASTPSYSTPAVPVAPAAPVAPVTPAAPAASSAPVTAPSGTAGSTKIESPMPGTILSINVNVGDTVEAGQAIIILEAMKMENEIVAPKAGKITSVNTTKGSSVNSGDLLATME